MKLTRRQFFATSSAALPLLGVPTKNCQNWRDTTLEVAPTIEVARVCYQLEFFRRSLLPIFLRRLNYESMPPNYYAHLKIAYLNIADMLQQALVNKVGFHDITGQYNRLFGELIAINKENKHRVWIPRQIDPQREIAKPCFTFEPESEILKINWRFPSATTFDSKSGFNHLFKEVVTQLDEQVDVATRFESTKESLMRSLQRLSKQQLIKAFSRMPLQSYFALIPTMFFVQPNSPLELLTIHREMIVGNDKTPDCKMYEIPIYRVDLSRLCGETMQVVGCNDFLRMREIAKLLECDGSWMCFYPGMILEMLYFKVAVLQFMGRRGSSVSVHQHDCLRVG